MWQRQPFECAPYSALVEKTRPYYPSAFEHAGNELGPIGAACVCDALHSNRALQTLNISYNRITNAGLPAVCALISANNDLISIILASKYSTASLQVCIHSA